MSESIVEKLQDLCAEHGCPPGINRFTWLDFMLNKVAKLEAERDALKDACFTAVMALAHASQRHPEYNKAYDVVSAAIAEKELK